MALSKSSVQSIRYVVICIAGILGFVLLSIFPTQRSLTAVQERIQGLERDIKEQRMLHPLYLDLVKKSESETPSPLPFPKKARLPRDETGEIADLFRRLAQQNDFVVESIVPDVVTLTGGSGYLMLDATLRGPFQGFRELLLRLGEIPYLEHIETIQIRTAGNDKQFRLKLWIAQQ